MGASGASVTPEGLGERQDEGPARGVVSGRYTAEFPAGTVVFLIGMRINRVRAVRQWLPVFRAMPRMIAELRQQPERGFLGARSWFGGRDVMVQQYWASMDQLLAYARDRDAEHLPAWRAFNRHVGTTPTVGVWHEAFAIRPEESHIIYHHMPPFGLGKATKGVSLRSGGGGGGGGEGNSSSSPPEAEGRHPLHPLAKRHPLR